MRDAVRCLAGQRDRVGAADQQVPGVQAQRRSRCRRAPARPRSRRSTIVPTCGCRVARTPALGGLGGEPVEVGRAAVASRVVERRALVVAVEPGRGGQHQRAGAGRDEARPGRGRPRAAGSWPASCSTTGTKPPTAREPVRGEGRRLRRRAVGQEAVRAELGRADARRRPSRRAPGRRRAGSPSPGTSQTPQEIGAPAIRSQSGRGHRRTSSTRHRAVLAPGQLAGLGDVERLAGRRRRCTATALGRATTSVKAVSSAT